MTLIIRIITIEQTLLKEIENFKQWRGREKGVKSLQQLCKEKNRTNKPGFRKYEKSWIQICELFESKAS